MDDFSRLDPTAHMLEWLSEDYRSAIRKEIVDALGKQVPGTSLDEFNVTSDPQWLSGAIRSEDDPNKAILVRTGVAFEFTLVATEPTGVSHQLHGVYSWVGVNLNDSEAAQQRMWFDIGGTLDQFGSDGELAERMYFA